MKKNSEKVSFLKFFFSTQKKKTFVIFPIRCSCNRTQIRLRASSKKLLTIVTFATKRFYKNLVTCGMGHIADRLGQPIILETIYHLIDNKLLDFLLLSGGARELTESKIATCPVGHFWNRSF